MAKLTVAGVLVLFAFVKLGSSLLCPKCAGDLSQCNKESATTELCPDGYTRCASMVLDSAESMHFLFGCAKPLDCQAATEACAEVTKEKSQTACTAKCCTGNNCVEPYEKDLEFRKCYHCTSMAECEMAKPTMCPNATDHCYKISTDVTHKETNAKVMTYSKGCATKDQCDSKNAYVYHQACSADENSKCEMDCCEDDMCNAGANVVVSALTLLACALLAVVRV